MTADELARQLKEDYGRAPKGDKVVAIHLFGIRNASALEGYSAHDIAERAGIGRSFGTRSEKAFGWPTTSG